MSITAADVLKMIKDKEVKFVDLRFTDTRGKEQHVSVPTKAFDADKFESGHAFDGQHRSVHGRGDAAADLRRDRAGGRQGLRARSALARQARRGVSEVDRA